MFCKHVLLITAISFLISFGITPGFAEVTVDPIGFAVSTVDEIVELELTLFNSGETPVAYSLKTDLIEEEERRGPRRDDLGDAIADFATPGGWWTGLCSDGELIYGYTHNAIDGGNMVISLNPEDGEITPLFNAGISGTTGMTYADGEIWVAHRQENDIKRYDLEGERLGVIRIPSDAAVGIAYDGENCWCTMLPTRNYVMLISPDGEELRRVAIGDYTDGWSTMEWVPDHPGGEMWFRDHGRNIYQLNLEGDEAEIIQTFEMQAGNEFGITHDGENLWYNLQAGGRWYCVDDGVAEMRLVNLEPRDGEIAGDDEVVIAVSVTPEGNEAGFYNIFIEIELEYADGNVEIVEIASIVSIDEPVAEVTVFVADAATDESVMDVTTDLYQYAMTRFTDEDGLCYFENLPPSDYDFLFTAPDYLPLEANLEIDGEGEVQLNVELLHSQCNPDIEAIVEELPAEESMMVEFNITNDGNGPLSYTTDRRLLGDANAEPWEHRVGVPAGVVVEDARVHGAVFINDHFYASGANDGEAAIYVLNSELELVEQYAQLGESRYGYKDLATDGETIWGSGERIVFEFTPDGEEVSSFDCGISPCNNLAWDSDRDILWCSGTTTNIVGFDRDGNQVGEVDRQNLRVYGLAYWPDDPDGYQLYVYHKVREVGNLMVAKYDIENNQVMEVANLQHEIGGVAQGCFITNQYDIYSWVFMGVANSGAEDRVDIWQIDARKDWMEINPTEGIIVAGEQEGFEVTLDASGLPEALFEGEIVFSHDGIGGETHVPITLQVGEGQGGGPEELVLELANGWNTVSAYVQPDPDDIVEIMSGLVDAETLIMVKNGNGQFYNPQFGFNNIPGWMVDEGYMIKMDGADELTLIGEPVPWDQAIALDPGWQMISYYPRQGVNAVLALSGIVDVLLMAKDGAGHFYSPAFGFSNMGDMIAGQGYLLKMDEAAELVYTVEEEVVAESTPIQLPRMLPIHPNTGENMSLLVLTDLQDGELGVYANDRFVGSGVIQNGKCGIAVWGDDEMTEVKDGLSEGETFTLKMTDNIPLKVSRVISGNGLVYSKDDFTVVELESETQLPSEYFLSVAFPNPFNSVTSLSYGLPESSTINIRVYDDAGRYVTTLIDGDQRAGSYSVTWDARDVPSGIYLVRLEAGSHHAVKKAMLIK
ncbi:MAG: T9SS type A sorting domain-containing protein [Calditrichaeota bacterium]|nr:T9SS type A sorting domain-containing protein [Calditrichota bacterium]